MTTEPTGYENEPREIFHPLPPDLAAQFYKIELDSFSDDLEFYARHLPKSGKIIELGCGTGRLVQPLARLAREFYATDISPAMLHLAKQQSTLANNPSFICMDMCRPALAIQFDAAIIGYNTMNLLSNQAAVMECLAACRELLKPGGHLLVQLHVQSAPLPVASQTTFHFQIFDHPAGGQLIKEVRKTPNGKEKSITIQERFRVRLKKGNSIEREDYEHCYDVLAWTFAEWEQVFKQSGYLIEEMWESYSQYKKEKLSPLRMLKLTPQ